MIGVKLRNVVKITEQICSKWPRRITELHRAQQHDCRPELFQWCVSLYKRETQQSAEHKELLQPDGIQSMIITGTFIDWNSPVRLSGDSRISQEEQVEHGVILEEVDEGPAQNPSTQSQQDQPHRDQSHVPHQRRRTRQRGLKHTHTVRVREWESESESESERERERERERETHTHRAFIKRKQRNAHPELLSAHSEW